MKGDHTVLERIWDKSWKYGWGGRNCVIEVSVLVRLQHWAICSSLGWGEEFILVWSYNSQRITFLRVACWMGILLIWTFCRLRENPFFLPRNSWEIALFKKKPRRKKVPCLSVGGHHSLPEWVGKRHVNAEVTFRLVGTVHTQPQASRIATACCKCKDCKKLGRTKKE